MWSLNAPAPLLGLVALALLPSVTAKPYPVHIEGLHEPSNSSQIEKRQCAGTLCGWYKQLCCSSGTVCSTNANNEAVCVSAGAEAGGVTEGWRYYTSTWVETDLVTRTSVWSEYVGVTAQATPTGSCTGARSPCGTTCCDSGYYCYAQANNDCRLFVGGSSGGIIATGSPTATVPFSAPIATGVNGTLVEQTGGGGGLSGGAIAGIVIGVIAGIILLLLICMYCCAKAAFDGIAAIFGFGKKRKHTHEETYIEEHHHSSAAGGGRRRWYGQPARPGRPPKKSGGFGNVLGLGAALGGLALALGIKRRHDRRHDDKSTTISGSSAYYSDYTSSSSASSSDRRSRPTRHSSRR